MKLATQFLVLIVTLLCGLQAHAERTTTFYHTDGLGSVVAATDQSGAVLWRKDYAPYGEQIDSTPDSESIAYTGKQHDDVTGLRTSARATTTRKSEDSSRSIQSDSWNRIR